VEVDHTQIEQLVKVNATNTTVGDAATGEKPIQEQPHVEETIKKESGEEEQLEQVEIEKEREKEKETEQEQEQEEQQEQEREKEQQQEEKEQQQEEKEQQQEEKEQQQEEEGKEQQQQEEKEKEQQQEEKEQQQQQEEQEKEKEQQGELEQQEREKEQEGEQEREKEQPEEQQGEPEEKEQQGKQTREREKEEEQQQQGEQEQEKQESEREQEQEEPGGKGNTTTSKYRLTMGMASVKRGTTHSQTTLLQTLRFITSKMNTTELNSTKLFVFNLQQPPTAHDQIDQVHVEFQNHIQGGFLEVVNNHKGYGQLLNASTILRTHDDTIERILWRSKENLDFCLVAETASMHGELFLFLEDDVKPTDHFLSKMMKYFDTPPLNNLSDWFMFSLYTPYPGTKDRTAYPFGCCTQAMVFQSKDIPALCGEIKRKYAQDPVDWILRDYLEASHRQLYFAIPNLFQHVTTISSLKEKTFMHTSPSFREH